MKVQESKGGMMWNPERVIFCAGERHAEQRDAREDAGRIPVGDVPVFQLSGGFVSCS